jgi:hypothetical protein
MSLTIRNTGSLRDPSSLKLKMLLYGPSGMGKSTFITTAPKVVVAACETGHGGGLLSTADKNIDYVLPENYSELEQFCGGHGLEAYETIAIDGFSYATDTIIKNYALTIPRARGPESKKRQMGILELDDYQVLAELERRLLAKLLSLDKHIIVTCLMDNYQPPTEDRPEKFGSPDLPGMMRVGSAAMFDCVFRLWTKPALKNPADPKSRYYQRVFLTEGDGKYLSKSRLCSGVTNVFPAEVEFNLETGSGTFAWFLAKAQVAFSRGEAAAIAQ